MLGASRADSRKSRRVKPLFSSHGVSMDSLHAIGFYVSSGVSLAGAMGVALLAARGLRGASMAVVGVGLAGTYLSLSAGFVAAVAPVCYAGCAFLVASPLYRPLEGVAGPLWRQVGAIGAAALLAVLAYSAFRGDFVHASFYRSEEHTSELQSQFHLVC